MALQTIHSHSVTPRYVTFDFQNRYLFSNYLGKILPFDTLLEFQFHFLNIYTNCQL